MPVIVEEPHAPDLSRTDSTDEEPQDELVEEVCTGGWLRRSKGGTLITFPYRLRSLKATVPRMLTLTPPFKKLLRCCSPCQMVPSSPLGNIDIDVRIVI